MRAILRTQGRSDDPSELDVEGPLLLTDISHEDLETTEVPFDHQVWQ